jgi:hypothetical protein
MKNFIIFALFVGLLVSLYFNFMGKDKVPTQPDTNNNIQTITLGEDSLKLSIYYSPEQDTNRIPHQQTTGPNGDPQQLLLGTITYGTEPCDPNKDPNCNTFLKGGSGAPRPRPNVIPGPDQFIKISLRQLSSILVQRIKVGNVKQLVAR